MSSANTYPQMCSEVNLTCESCTSASARKLAAICKGLRGKAIGQLFVQIYTDPACARMHSHFAAHYREGADELEAMPVTEVLPARREVTRARGHAMFAAA